MSKKRLYGILAIIVIFLVLLVNNINNNNNSQEIRVRVIPNSNLKEDLEVKKLVKSDVIKFLEDNYESSYDEYKNKILKNIDKIENDLSNKYGHIELSLSNHTLYNKTYNDSALKNENTLTFLAVIGDGEGDNWWGTIYPKFLEVDSEEEVEYKSFIYEVFSKLLGE